MKNNKIADMVQASLFAAMIFLLTRLVQIPSPLGYIHFGDALIYTAASMLPAPYALAAGVLGASLADLTSGFAMYAPATVAVKLLVALPFALVKNKSVKILTPATALLTVLSGIITVGGYYLADVLINPAFALVNIPGNVAQAAGSAIIFIILAGSFDAAKIKQKLFYKGDKR